MDKIKVSDIRAKFPMYEDMPDEALIGAIRRKFYADIPMNQFVQRIDFDTEKARLDPTKGNSFAENLAAGIGRGMTELGRGAGQWAGLVSNEDIKEARKLDAPLMETGGGMVGNVVGQAAPAMLIPGAQSVLGAGLTGAALGALGPAESSSERAANTIFGGVGGSAIAGASKLAGGAAKSLYRAASPYLPGGTARIEGKAFRAIAGDKADDVVRALENSKQIVPGSLPTAGEASVAAKSPQFAALQEILSRGFVTDRYVSRDAAQQGARLAAVRNVSGTQSALESAIANRSAVAKQTYGAVNDDLIAPDEAFKMLASRPSMTSILKRAKDIAKEYGDDFKIGEDRAEEVIKSMIVDSTGNPAFSTVIPAQAAKYPVKSLQYMKMAMDDLIKSPDQFGIGATEAKAISGTQKGLVDWLSDKSPGWAAARNTYSEQSKPINQMQIGQYIENKLNSPLGSERAGMFAQAMRDAPASIKRATGEPRFNSLDEILTAQQLDSINKVQSELTRNAEFSALAKAGSQDTQRQLQTLFEPVDIPGYLDAKVTATRWLLGKLQGGGGTKEMRQMAIDMLDPQKVADLMKKAAPKDRPDIKALLNDLQKAAYASGSVTSAGVFGPAFVSE